MIWNGPLRIGCNFSDIPFCVTKFGTKTYVPIFRFVVGVNRDFFLFSSFLNRSHHSILLLTHHPFLFVSQVIESFASVWCTQI